MQQLTSLDITLKPEASLDGVWQSKNLGSCLQGALLDRVDTSYVAYLRRLPFMPYSQHCHWETGNLVWRVNTLTNEANLQIAEPLLQLDSLSLEDIGAQFKVIKTSQETASLKTLLDMVHEPGPSRFHLRFATPTAFKSRGAYAIMPSVRLIFQNLLMHYGQVYDDNAYGFDETVDYIDQNARILSYKLRSEYFDQISIGNSRVPAFVGTMTLGLRGPELISGLGRMLLRFGEYAGVGIKTAMGMGGFKCQEPR